MNYKLSHSRFTQWKLPVDLPTDGSCQLIDGGVEVFQEGGFTLLRPTASGFEYHTTHIRIV